MKPAGVNCKNILVIPWHNSESKTLQEDHDNPHWCCRKCQEKVEDLKRHSVDPGAGHCRSSPVARLDLGVRIFPCSGGDCGLLSVKECLHVLTVTADWICSYQRSTGCCVLCYLLGSLCSQNIRLGTRRSNNRRSLHRSRSRSNEFTF